MEAVKNKSMETTSKQRAVLAAYSKEELIKIIAELLERIQAVEQQLNQSTKSNN